jgi:hypothetical protein
MLWKIKINEKIFLSWFQFSLNNHCKNTLKINFKDENSYAKRESILDAVLSFINSNFSVIFTPNPKNRWFVVLVNF